MPSPGNFFQSIESLNTYDKGLLAKQTDTLMPLSAAQQKAFASSVSKALASAEGKPVLEDAAAAAAGACKDIKSQFVNLHQKLINIDGARAAADPNAVRFGPKLAALEMDYDTIIGSCKVLSSRVSVYCARFNGSIVPFTLSSAANVGVDQKLKLVDKYIGDADKFRLEAVRVQSRLNTLKDNFTAFMDSFTEFSKTEQPQFTAQIQDVNARLVALEQVLNVLRSQMQLLNVTKGVLAPVAAGLAAIFPAAAVFILAAGLVTGAGVAAGAAYISAQIATNEEDRNNLENELKSLRGADAKFRDATLELQQLSRDNSVKFALSIELVKDVFDKVEVDAVSIQEWLRDGGDIAAIPELAEGSFETAGAIYEEIAKYLEKFSDGL